MNRFAEVSGKHLQKKIRKREKKKTDMMKERDSK